MLEGAKDLLGQGWFGGLVGVIGLAVALFSVALAYYFYRKSLRVPKLLHYVHGFQVVGGPRVREAGEHLEVRFKGEPIQRLDIAWISIWNGGTGTLDSAALVPHDPLRIELPDNAELLEVSVIRVARDVNRIQLALNGESKRSICLKFDFLDPFDGVLLKVLHASAHGATPLVTGVLKGTVINSVRAPQIDDLRYPRRGYSAVQNFVWLLMTLTMLAFGALPDPMFAKLNDFMSAKDAAGHLSPYARASYILMACIQFGFWLTWRRERISPVPVSLRTPEEESAQQEKRKRVRSAFESAVAAMLRRVI